MNQTNNINESYWSGTEQKQMRRERRQMSLFDSWVKKYRNNVEGTLFDVFSLAIGLGVYQKTVVYDAGFFDNSRLELDDYLSPELFFYGLCKLKYIIIRCKKGDEEAVKAYSKRQETYKDAVDGISQKDINDFLFITYSTIVNEFKCDEDCLSIQCYCLQKELKKVLAKNDSRDFVKDTVALFDKTRYDGKILTVKEYYEFCKKYVLDGGIEQEEESLLNIKQLSEKYNQIREKLSEKVLGQEVAVRKFVQGLFNGEINQNKKSPNASFLFVGPPGVEQVKPCLQRPWLLKLIAHLLPVPVLIL